MQIKHSVVVPAFNEEGNLVRFLDETKRAMTGYTDSYEIIFINDGSTDNTAEILNELYESSKDVRIKVIHFSRNFGKEAAIYAGLSHASGEYITIIDADLQQDPKYMVQMGKILDNHSDCDIVAAFQEHRKENRLMTFCKSAFYKLAKNMTGADFFANASDFRTMRRCVAKTILSLSEYHRFSKGIFAWIGYRTRSIPYEVRERASGETKWGFAKLFRYALDGLIAYSDLPLRLPLYFSGLSGITAVLVFIIAATLDCSTTDSFSLAYVCALILLMTSALSFFLGILGYYLGKVHTQVKNRPIYIAREILTYEENSSTDQEI